VMENSIWRIRFSEEVKHYWKGRYSKIIKSQRLRRLEDEEWCLLGCYMA
jgi:hypothetical protein